MGVSPLGLVVLDTGLTNHGSKPVSSIPSWLLLQFLPCFHSAMDCDLAAVSWNKPFPPQVLMSHHSNRNTKTTLLTGHSWILLYHTLLWYSTNHCPAGDILTSYLCNLRTDWEPRAERMFLPWFQKNKLGLEGNHGPPQTKWRSDTDVEAFPLCTHYLPENL